MPPLPMRRIRPTVCRFTQQSEAPGNMRAHARLAQPGLTPSMIGIRQHRSAAPTRAHAKGHIFFYNGDNFMEYASKGTT